MRKLFVHIVIAAALLVPTAAARAQGPVLERFYTLPGVDAGALAAHAFRRAMPQPATPSALLDQARKIASEHFYNPAGLQPFVDALQGGRETAQTVAEAGALISQALRALKVSHTARYTPDQIEYYELLDILRPRGFEDAPVFHDRDIAYEGVGMVARPLEGRTFVTMLYDGAAAQKAGLRVGDEIVAVDGNPYRPIDSFKGRVGGKATFRIRRQADAETIDIDVPVAWVQPNSVLKDAIRNSVRVVESGGVRIATIRLWTYGSNNMRGLLTELIASEPVRSADGLVLDLRSRWGGYGSEAADFFLSRTRGMTITGPDGKERPLVARWYKPMVAIIDQGTRSSMEIIAYSLQRSGVPLIGQSTAGAVLTVRAFLLADGSLMLLAINDVRLDGKRFEGVGVAPDIAVPFDPRYANGADPQFDRAVLELQRRLVN
jgi:carboxyl-terminal processing protease